MASTHQASVFDPPAPAHPETLLSIDPLYRSPEGAAYVGDSRDLLAMLPDESVDLVVTSPPYALHFEKEYGNVAKDEYVDWFLPFAEQVYRVLNDTGSFVLNIGGSYNEGEPTRSLYHFKLLIRLVEDIGFWRKSASGTTPRNSPLRPSG